MKATNLFLPAFAMLCSLLLCSCHTDMQNATKAAYEYSYAMANYNVDDAEPYATEETKSTTLVKARQLVEAVDKKYIESDTPAELEITNIEFTSDTTAIATYHKTTPIKNMTGTLELRKRNGNWLAHVTIPVVARPEPQAPKTKDGKEIKEFQPETKGK